MSYTKTDWVNDHTPVNAQNMNNIEEGIAAAHTEIAELKGNTKTSMEELEKKVGEGYGVIDERVQTIERDVLTPAEQATTNAQNAADLASAAAETAMAADRAGGVLDVAKKTTLYFGSGNEETLEELAPVLPGNTFFLDEEDTAWEDLLEDVKANSENIEINAEDIKKLSVDYIVEEGTADGWTYRKWNSGIAECWSGEPYTLSWSGISPAYYSTNRVSVVFPTGLFVDAPNVLSNFRNNTGAYVFTGPMGGGATGCEFAFGRIMGGTNDTQGWLHIHAIGRWK